MGIHDTNAATAFEGLLQPIEVDESGDPFAQGASDSAEKIGTARPDAVVYRPRQRPPIPVLLLVDDSQRTAESVRIRKSPFQIGRTEGDVTIPLDGQLSTRHAQLSVRNISGKYIWHLKDLGSTNGTFVRVSRVRLNPGQVLLIGSHRLRFESPSENQHHATETMAERTQQWRSQDSDAAAETCPYLVDLERPSQFRIPLRQQELWVGRDVKQATMVLDDPLVSPRHMRLYCGAKGEWHAESTNSLNGVWAKIDEVALGRSCWFQCGEQRFILRPSE